MYIKRALEDKVRYLAEHFPVVLVCGARQVGKTTLLKKIAEKNKNIQYVTLDYPRVRQLAWKILNYFFSNIQNRSLLMKYNMHLSCYLS